jgi:hypothetical protein
MGWANDAKSDLAAGRQTKVRPLGGSMRGRIESGQLVTLAPVLPADVQLDDIVFIQWHGGYILHIVKDLTPDQVLIGNNLGKINGWAPRTAILGKVVAIEKSQALPNGND